MTFFFHINNIYIFQGLLLQLQLFPEVFTSFTVGGRKILKHGADYWKIGIGQGEAGNGTNGQIFIYVVKYLS